MDHNKLEWQFIPTDKLQPLQIRVQQLKEELLVQYQGQQMCMQVKIQSAQIIIQIISELLEVFQCLEHVQIFR